MEQIAALFGGTDKQDPVPRYIRPQSDSDTAVPRRLEGVPPLWPVHPLPPRVTAADWHHWQPDAAAAEGRHRPYEEELLAIFRMIDQDENGVIDFSELLDLGKAVNAAFTAAKCRAVLGWMDEDHDGTVTKEEFVAFFGKLMKKFSQSANDRGIVQVLSMFDDMYGDVYEHVQCVEACVWG